MGVRKSSPFFLLMGITAIAKRSNQFVSRLPVHVAQAVLNVETKLVDMNRRQMLTSKRADGAPITPLYSKPYARKKGFNKPNLYVSGEFQSEMFLHVNENEGTFFISSFDEKMKYLIKMYSQKIFGIAPKDLPEAQKISVDQLRAIYYLYVFNC